MMTSIFLAKAMGLYFLIMGLALVIRGDYLRSAFREIVGERGSFFLLTVITLIIGILLILSHNIWIVGWPILITLLGWIIFLSAIIRLCFFNEIQKYAYGVTNHPRFHWFGIIPIILGAVLLICGFYG